MPAVSFKGPYYMSIIKFQKEIALFFLHIQLNVIFSGLQKKEVKLCWQWDEEGGRGSKFFLTFSLMLDKATAVDLESLECSSAEEPPEKYIFGKYTSGKYTFMQQEAIAVDL